MIIALLALPAVSVAQSQPEQVVHGRVLIPNKDRQWEECNPGANDDIDGDSFKVDPETWGHPFVLRATSGYAVDLDIVFEGNGLVGWSTQGLDGEHGTVPEGATGAEVCIRQGLQAEYVYRAGPGVPRPTLSDESQDASHSANLRLLAHEMTGDSVRKLAFQNNMMVTGSNDGVNIFRLRDERPYLDHISFYECYGGSGDISIWGDYVFQSTSGRWPYVILARPDRVFNNQLTDTCNSTHNSQGKIGIRVVDISDPTHPTQAGFIETPCGSQTHTFVPHRGRLYIYVPIPCDDSIPDASPVKPFTNQIHVLRFDPDRPGRSEHVGTPKLDGQFGCYDIVVFPARDLAACPQYFNPAFGSALLDISDPTNPDVIGRLSLPEDVQWPTFAAFTWDGNYLLIGDTNSAIIDNNFFLAPYCTGDDSVNAGRIWIFDVRNPRSGRTAMVGSIYLPRPPRARDHQCAPNELNVIPMKDPDRYIAVVGWHAGGLTIVDFSQPEDPREIAYWQPAPASQIRGTYWYNGRIYSSEFHTAAGVRVFELAGATDREALRYTARLNPQTQLAEFR